MGQTSLQGCSAGQLLSDRGAQTLIYTHVLKSLKSPKIPIQHKPSCTNVFILVSCKIHSINQTDAYFLGAF